MTRICIIIALTVGGVFTFPAIANAINGQQPLTATCGSTPVLPATTLATALSTAGSGTTITLTGICTGTDAPNGFTLPSLTSLTIVGADSNSGFDLTNMTGNGSTTGSALYNNEAQASTITLQNLIFENAHGASPALHLLGNYSINLNNDQFMNNSTTSGGSAALFTQMYGSRTVSMTSSTFTNNTSHASGGAVEITSNAGPPAITLTSNTFSVNSVTTNGVGGALYVDGPSSSSPPLLTQSNNVFTSNSIASQQGSSNGGAEEVENYQLTSTSDRFTGNSLPAPTAIFDDEGSALSDEWTNCYVTPPTNTVTNLVATGNAIDVPLGNPIPTGTASNAHGTIYVGNPCYPTTTPNNLTLNNATITSNSSVSGGTAGIFGDPLDHLTLNNSIVNGDTGGGELSGFAAIAVASSDLCNGSSPYTGTGNICSAPSLTTGSSGAVYETTTSPTIDAGSNTLVPGGVTTDLDGNTRIQPHYIGGSAVVDMGAEEFNTVAVPTGTTGSSGGGSTATTTTTTTIAPTTTTTTVAPTTTTIKVSVAPPPAGVPTASFGTPTSGTVSTTAASTVVSSSGGSMATVSVPTGALPSGTVVSVYPVSNASTLTSAIDSGQSTGQKYVLSFGVSWVTPSGTSPTASAPITMTITDPSIKKGDIIYEVTSHGLAEVGKATVDGSATISFTNDPIFTVAAVPNLMVAAKQAVLGAKGITVKLHCQLATSCQSTASFIVVRHVADGKKMVRKVTTIATAKVSLDAGSSKSVTLALTPAGRSLLSHVTSSSIVRLALTTHVIGGNPTSNAITIVVNR